MDIGALDSQLAFPAVTATMGQGPGMAYYLVVFQGGNALGSAVLGITAEHLGLTRTVLVDAVALALGPLAGLRYRFQSIPPQDLVPAGDWPQPTLAVDTQPVGPVLVSVDYHAAEGHAEEMVAALEAARFSRRRTGATLVARLAGRG